MKRLLISLITMLVASTALLARDYEIPVGEFTKLKVPNDIYVVYNNHPDSVGMAVLRNCDPDMASSVIFSNNKGTLKVEVATDYKDNPRLPMVYVYSTSLKEVNSSSNKNVYVLSPAAIPEFKAKLYGNGNLVITDVDCDEIKAQLMTGRGIISITGKCGSAFLSLTGTGEIQADNLTAGLVKCSIWGTGAIYCHPVDELRSDGIGTTKIFYVGNPAKMKKTGGGKFIPMEP